MYRSEYLQTIFAYFQFQTKFKICLHVLYIYYLIELELTKEYSVIGSSKCWFIVKLTSVTNTLNFEISNIRNKFAENFIHVYMKIKFTNCRGSIQSYLNVCNFPLKSRTLL